MIIWEEKEMCPNHIQYFKNAKTASRRIRKYHHSRRDGTTYWIKNEELNPMKRFTMDKPIITEKSIAEIAAKLKNWETPELLMRLSKVHAQHIARKSPTNNTQYFFCT